jgi:hypothetical protein
MRYSRPKVLALLLILLGILLILAQLTCLKENLQCFGSKFQMQIRQELELLASQLENISNYSESASDPIPCDDIIADAETTKVTKDKAKELSLNIKSITQLYNDYGVPFNLWEV